MGKFKVVNLLPMAVYVRSSNNDVAFVIEPSGVTAFVSCESSKTGGPSSFAECRM